MGYRVAFGRSLALGSSAHYDGRYTSWLESWYAQEEGELTTCRLGVRDCAGLDPIVSLPHTPLYLETSMHFYGLEFPPGENRWFFVSVGLFYKGRLSWSTEGGGTNKGNLVY